MVHAGFLSSTVGGGQHGWGQPPTNAPGLAGVSLLQLAFPGDNEASLSGFLPKGLNISYHNRDMCVYIYINIPKNGIS